MGDDEAVARPADATIYDVAKAAGVSPSTVSRAFSRPGRVSSQTAEKIRAVAAELGYRSREIARPTVKSATRVIGVAVADITNPFNFRVIRGCESAAVQAGFMVSLHDSQESDALERQMMRRALPLLDGLVIASSRMSDTELRTVAKTLPTVVLNRRVPGVPCIVPDMGRGVRRAIEHLVSEGHHHIAYLAGPEASWADGMRWRTIREAAHELGFTEHRIGPYAPTIQGGRAAANAVLAKKHRAIITYNDVMAIGLMKALAERGVRVPEHVSLVGFDNVFASELTTPGLTTIAAPLTMLGESAVKYIVSLLNNTKLAEPLPATLPVRMVFRESTGPYNPHWPE